ncbi:MAG TPA: amino acid adenylation domain-containing protein [Vicinamibacterales bacterium]|nr:amino acid adenylation domain-containing protein [Vicinamibacterales bacterium]
MIPLSPSPHGRRLPVLCRRSATTAPTSPAQRRFWFLEQLSPGTAAHHIPIVTQFSGAIDVPALESALRTITGRHEILRTRFVMLDGQPIQQIEAEAPPFFVHRDFSRDADGHGGAHAWLQEHVRSPFDLARLPLFRAALATTSTTEHTLVLVAHHIVMDAWSAGVLRRELTALYEAERRRVPADLPTPVIQFADYAAWQAEMLGSDHYGRQTAYWTRHLADAPALTLVSDRPRPVVRTARGSTVPVRLDEPASAALRLLSRQVGVTLPMTLLAAYQVLLAHHSGQTDVAVGLPVANRNRTELEDLIGPFVNTIVLRTDLAGRLTVRDLLARVRAGSLDAYSNQDVPFERVVELLQPVRDLSRTPVFQAMFSFQPETGIRLAGVQARRQSLALDVSRVDVTLQLGDGPGIGGFLEFSTDLFDIDRVAGWARHFSRILDAMAADTGRSIDSIALLTDESPRMPAGNPDPVVALPTITQEFEARVQQQPQATAVICGDRQHSYAELNARTNRLAAILRARGCAAETRVAVALERSIDLPTVLLAILKTGAAFVPFDPAHPAARLAEMLAGIAPICVVTSRAAVAKLPEQFPTVILDSPDTTAALNRQETQEATRPASSAEVPARTLAYVLFTSGSTGTPKAVMVDHHALSTFLFAMQETVPFAPGDSHVAVTTPTFDISILELLGPLVRGATVIIVTDEARQDLASIRRLVTREPATSLQATPTLWTALVTGMSVPRRTRALSGGEALPRGLARQLLRTGAQVWNLYGPTEATIWATAHSVGEPDVADDAPGIVSLGRALPGYRLRVLDHLLRPTALGVAGEIYIAGPALARGYWQRPGLTATRFVAESDGAAGSRMYRTGDLGRWRADGTIEYLGRTDHQIKLRGHRIEPGEIESVLRAHPMVQEAVVLLRGEDRMPALLAFVLRRLPDRTTELEDQQEDRQLAGQLEEALRSRLPPHMVPATVTVMRVWPTTPAGKLDRQALPTPSLTARTHRPPRSPHEEIVCRILAAALHASDVGIDDDFFALGGHSLAAMQAIGEIREAFGVTIPVPLFFAHPTVAGLGHVIERQLLKELEGMAEEDAVRLLAQPDDAAKQ